MSNNEDLQPDLQPVVAQLRAHRPEATALELDAIKQRVRTRVSQPARRRTRRTELMKSRMVILTTLVFGMLLSTAGAGLAVTGLAANNDASVAVYGANNNVLGEQDQGTDSQDVLPEDDSGDAPAGGNAPAGGGDDAVQPSRQVEVGADTPTTGSQLPFTGFAAIPILLIGIAMLTAGLVLRRQKPDAG